MLAQMECQNAAHSDKMFLKQSTKLTNYYSVRELGSHLVTNSFLQCCGRESTLHTECKLLLVHPVWCGLFAFIK